MSRNDATSAMVDGLLRFLAAGGLLTTAVIAPNAVQLWDKPVQRLFARLDQRSQQREYRRLLRYMRQQGLVENQSVDYAHGLALTDAGRKRAEKAAIDQLTVPLPKRWDGSWRIVFFDIPEALKTKRDYFSRRLQELGMQQLQRSVWVHPYPCRQEVEAIAVGYEVERYVTYIETAYIDASEQLQARFAAILKGR